MTDRLLTRDLSRKTLSARMTLQLWERNHIFFVFQDIQEKDTFVSNLTY